MTRVLTVAALILATLVFVPMMFNSPVEAAPPTAFPGEPGEPGGDWPECPWHARIEIVDCDTGEVTGWRVKAVWIQSQCAEAIAELTAAATGIHRECVGESSCTEYSWCED